MTSALPLFAIALQATATAPPREDVYLLVSLALLGLALVLLVLEMFLPTGGVLAVLTGVAAVASIASMFIYDTTWGAIYLAVICAGSPVAVVVMIKLWSKTPIAKRMVLSGGADGPATADHDDERQSNPGAPAMGVAAKANAKHLTSFVGRKGIAATTLRPVGFVRIDDARIDAVAESGYIELGREIVVLEVVDGQLKVRDVHGSLGN